MVSLQLAALPCSSTFPFLLFSVCHTFRKRLVWVALSQKRAITNHFLTKTGMRN